MADQVAHLAHLNARDTTFVNVSRAPQADIERWKARMGWEIPWYTITDDFDADFGVDEWHGTNAFYRDDDDRIFRTYFVDKRGDEALGTAWSYLDITALGRQEKWEDSPEGYPQTQPYVWWNLHDEYDEATVFEHAPVETPPPRSAARDAARDRQRHDAAHRAHVPGARRRGLRRVDQRGGDAALVAGRARLGDARGRGRPARRRRRARRHARPRQGRRPRRRRPLHGDRAADAAWRSPGSGTATRGGR